MTKTTEQNLHMALFVSERMKEMDEEFICASAAKDVLRCSVQKASAVLRTGVKCHVFRVVEPKELKERFGEGRELPKYKVYALKSE